MRLREAMVGFVLLLAIGGVAACGGGDENEGLSRSVFVARGDALCTQARQQTPRAPATRDPARLARYLDAVDRVSTATLTKFRALKPPAGLRDLAGRFLASANARLADVRRARDAARRGDRAGLSAALRKQERDGVTYRRLAQQIGFKVCGSGG